MLGTENWVRFNSCPETERYTYNLTIGYISNLTIGCIFIHTCHTCQVYILAYLYILANYKSCKIGSKLICQWIKTLHDQSVNLLIYQKCTLSYKVFLIIWYKYIYIFSTNTFFLVEF